MTAHLELAGHDGVCGRVYGHTRWSRLAYDASGCWKELGRTQLEIIFNNGYALETNDKLGLVNFTMSMVDEGTEKYSGLEFAEEVASLGSGIGFGSSIENETRWRRFGRILRRLTKTRL